MCFFVQTNHTRKELLFLMFKEINLRNHSSLHKLFYSLDTKNITFRFSNTFIILLLINNETLTKISAINEIVESIVDLLLSP